MHFTKMHGLGNDYLLDRAQIVGTPGEGFGACGEGYFRFSTFGNRKGTQEAARRLVALLSQGAGKAAGVTEIQMLR